MSIAGISLDQLLILPITLVAFIALLTIIVFFHEYGHFSMARLLGVRVDVFSIGFGKPLAQWVDKKGTQWRIAMLPFGGYVKFFGDAGPASDASDMVKDEKGASGDHEKEGAALATTQFPKPGDDAGRGLSPEEKAVCFHFKPVWARALIVAAGPFANFLLAIAIFWGLLSVLGEGDFEPVIGEVMADSAAAEGGFVAGDRVLAINNKKIKRFDDLRYAVMLGAGDALRFEVERSGETITVTATPRRQDSTDAFGNTVRVGILGVRPDADTYRFRRYEPLSALGAATAKVWNVLETTVKYIGRLLMGKEDTRQLGGPLKMAQYAGQSAVSGFDESDYREKPSFWTKFQVSLANFINLAAVVSISIGFLNLLPIPVLDGGHLMYYGYEAIAGKPLGAKAQAIGFRVGLAMLASLMIFVTWNDINSLLSINS